MDAIDEPLVCRDVRDPTEPTLSNSAPRYLPSSLTFLLSFSFLPLLEKKDLPPDDCRALSAADMIDKKETGRFDYCDRDPWPVPALRRP